MNRLLGQRWQQRNRPGRNTVCRRGRASSGRFCRRATHANLALRCSLSAETTFASRLDYRGDQYSCRRVDCSLDYQAQSIARRGALAQRRAKNGVVLLKTAD
jgi:hypothetical protein